MSARELRRRLAAADPVDRERLARLDFAAMEAELTADLEESWPVADPGRATDLRAADAGLLPRPHHRRPRTLVLAGGAGALAVIVVALVLVFAGGGGSSSRAYGAELIRFAESTPLLLLDQPDWRVQDVREYKSRHGTDGTMEFVTGKPVTLEGIRPVGPSRSGKQIVKGLPSTAARQRLVMLGWRPEAEGPPPTEAELGGHVLRLPVAGTTAIVATRAERFAGHAKPGDREMAAFWSEGGDVIELRAAVPDLAAMEERLEWVAKVDSQTWLEAMPAKVVKAADFEGGVKEILVGIPLPKTFSISRVPNEGLTTARASVATEVTSTVACLWLRQWGEARRSGDEAAEAEATKALDSSSNWPVFRELGAEKPYTARDIQEVAAAMPRGYWIYRGHPQDLLAHAESLGCARLGLPLVPEKQRRQRENGVPPPPG